MGQKLKFSVLLLLLAIPGIGQTRDIYPSKKGYMYIEVRHKMDFGKKLLSFRLCDTRVQPCDTTPLGWFDWHCQQGMETQLFMKKVGLDAIIGPMEYLLRSERLKKLKKEQEDKLKVLTLAFTLKDHQLDDRDIVEFAEALDTYLKEISPSEF